jgi:SAM-dependent methyltransferase
MSEPPAKNSDQSALWNGPGGQAWVESQAVLERMLQPFEELLVEDLAKEAPRRVLDVGCGMGGTTIAFGRRLGGDARCTGVDISAPMLAVARTRAASEPHPPTFLLADAQTHAFEPASFDALVSRFGVMFFDDPVQAFTNLRRAAAVGARLRFVAWRSPEENPFMTLAERVAAPLLPTLSPRRADEPGQFGFADGERVQRILAQSGWSRAEVQAIDVPCRFPEQDLLHYMTRMGPVGRLLPEVPEPIRAELLARLRAGLDPYVHGAEVRFTSACWMVTAVF